MSASGKVVCMFAWVEIFRVLRGMCLRSRAGEACGGFSRNYQTDFQYDCTILFSYWQCLNDTGKSGASEFFKLSIYTSLIHGSEIPCLWPPLFS